MSHILEFLDLVDAPSTYTDKGGFWVVVNSGATALEFVTKTLADTAVSLSGSHTGLLNGEASVADAMVALDDLDDTDIPLAGAEHVGLLAFATHVDDAMVILDGLEYDSTYLKLDASNDPISGALELSSTLTMQNNQAIYMDNLDTTPRAILGMDTNNLLHIGQQQGGGNTVVYGYTSLELETNSSLGLEIIRDGAGLTSITDAVSVLIKNDTGTMTDGFGGFIHFGVEDSASQRSDILTFEYQSYEGTFYKGLKEFMISGAEGEIGAPVSTDLLGFQWNATDENFEISTIAPLKYGVKLQGHDSSGTALDVVQVSGDTIIFGDVGEDIGFYGYLSGGISIDNSTATTRDIFNTWTGAATGYLLRHGTTNGFEIYDDLYFQNNNTGISMDDSGGTQRNALHYNSSDILEVGWNGGLWAAYGLLKGSGLYVAADDPVLRATGKTTTEFVLSMDDDHQLICHQPFRMDNNVEIQGTNVAGTSHHNLVMMSSSDIAVFGDNSVNAYHYTAGTAWFIGSNVRIDNDYAFMGREVAGTARDMLQMNPSDQVTVGNTSNALKLVSAGFIYAAGALDISSHVYLENAKYLYGKETGSTSRVLIGLNGSDQVVIGNSVDDILWSSVANSDLSFRNTKGIRGITSESGSRVILRLASNDKVQVGNANQEMELFANGTIDAKTNDITTTGEVIATEGDFPHIRATHQKAITDGSNTEIARSFMDGSAPKWTSVTIYYEVVAENLAGTHMQMESGLVTLSMVRIGSTNTASTAVKAATATVTTSGSMTCAWSVGISGTDHARIRLLANSDFGTPTITGYFTIIGNKDNAITWS